MPPGRGQRRSGRRWGGATTSPPAIEVILSGRIRVELTHQEAVEALLWAAAVPGWASAEPKPLFLYDPRAEL